MLALAGPPPAAAFARAEANDVAKGLEAASQALDLAADHAGPALAHSVTNSLTVLCIWTRRPGLLWGDQFTPPSREWRWVTGGPTHEHDVGGTKTGA